MGVAAPYVPWGVHPEYLEYTPHRPDDVVDFHYHAGLLGKRKPFKEVVNAFSDTTEPELRLIVKAQIERRMKFLERAVKKDSRVELVLEDLPTEEHLQKFADSHVCMAPARWEGLGLHLYEAIAFGMPIVCNDDAPMNELVTDGVNGLLVPSHEDGLANSGIPAKTVDVPGLTRAISRLADPGLRAELSAGALAKREERNWGRTVQDVAELLR
jgi:glycosyltransferase involved in cell wall biosynthesis